VTLSAESVAGDQLGELLRFINGYRVSQCIYVAVELGIFDLIEERARTVDELAEMAQCHAKSLYRVLRLLADSGVAERPVEVFCGD